MTKVRSRVSKFENGNMVICDDRGGIQKIIKDTCNVSDTNKMKESKNYFCTIA